MDRLIEAAGEWSGTSLLQDPGMNLEARTTSSGLTITPLMGGRFVRIDYTWSYDGKPQWGSMLVGHQKAAGTHTVHWIDSWHNGESVMACSGPARNGAIAVRGSYPAPPGPDWGWRIDLEPASDALRIVMHNVSPDGQEELAVEGHYRRAERRN